MKDERANHEKLQLVAQSADLPQSFKGMANDGQAD